MIIALGSVNLAIWLAIGVLLIGAAVWTKRHLQWTSIIWVCIGVGLSTATNLVAGWINNGTMAAIAVPPLLWGLTLGEVQQLYMYLQMATSAAVSGLLILLVLGDVVRLAAQAGIDTDGRYVSAIRILTQKPTALGTAALALSMVHLVWAGVLRQQYG